MNRKFATAVDRFSVSVAVTHAIGRPTDRPSINQHMNRLEIMHRQDPETICRAKRRTLVDAAQACQSAFTGFESRRNDEMLAQYFRSRSAPRCGVLLLLLAVCFSLTGCTSLVQPIRTIPAHRVPRQFLAEPQASKEPIDFTRLRQTPSDEYRLDAGDVLGVYISSGVGSLDDFAPVQQALPNSDLSSATGRPVVVRDDGTISVPLYKPIQVRGLTVDQVQLLLFNKYTGQDEEGRETLKPEEAVVTVDIMQKRSYQIIVVRQDNPIVSDQQVNARQSGPGSGRTDYSSRGFVINLEAYKNDVLNALAQTGGLPGVNAKAEVTILRGNEQRWQERDRLIRDWVDRYGDCKDPCFVPPPIPDDPNALRIPLRVNPGSIIDIKQEDIILGEGDIVLVETRDTEVYYTGGNLPGGQFPIPRDFDLDVLGAIAIAGGSVGQSSSLGTGLVQAVGAVPPGELIILRRTPGDGQIAISVDLVRAINNPRSRLLVKSGDTLILRYKPEEELLNFGLGTFFTYGIRELLSRR